MMNQLKREEGEGQERDKRGSKRREEEGRE